MWFCFYHADSIILSTNLLLLPSPRATFTEIFSPRVLDIAPTDEFENPGQRIKA